MAWEIPDFAGEQEKWEDFKKRDLYDKREHFQNKRSAIEAEQQLEKFIKEKAWSYVDYMNKRSKAEKGAARDTLRTKLASFYQEMLKDH